jgi:dihydroxyacetone kinase
MDEKRMMTHVLNSPLSFKDDLIEGLTRAYPRFVERIPGASGIRAVGSPFRGRVSILIGGGSGHYPAFAGFVGAGLATGAAMGEVFASPSSEQVYRCAKAVDGGAGIVFSYGNYSGDVMNFDMSAEMLGDEGIEVETVLVTDDVASAPADRSSERRGIAGDFCVFKVLGAAAASGAGLPEITDLGRRANERTRSIGVAFEGCTLPGGKGPMFIVAEDKIELGLGIHGEPGVSTISRVEAQPLARILVDHLLPEAPRDSDGRVAVLVNGLGSTSGEELFVLYGGVATMLDSAGLKVEHCEVGELATSLDMAGCSLTIFWLDDELAELYMAPAAAPGYRSGSR